MKYRTEWWFMRVPRRNNKPGTEKDEKTIHPVYRRKLPYQVLHPGDKGHILELRLPKRIKDTYCNYGRLVGI